MTSITSREAAREAINYIKHHVQYNRCNKTMGILGTIEQWLEKRKNSKPAHKRKPFAKLRKGMGVANTDCPMCSHHKAFKKMSTNKCCKCGFKWTS